MQLRVLASVFLAITILMPVASEAKEDVNKKKKNGANGVQTGTSKSYIRANRIKGAINNDALNFYEQAGQGNSGLEWPKAANNDAQIAAATTKTIFNSGIWIGTKYNGGGVRTAAIANTGSAGTEFQPGALSADGVPGSITDPLARVFRINRGDSAGSNPDYRDWPFQLGAPYATVKTNNGSDSIAPVTGVGSVEAGPYRGEPWPSNSAGVPLNLSAYSTKQDVYNAKVLVPGLVGDQSLWTVYNDVKPVGQRAFSTQPIGAEVGQLVFSFNNQGTLGDIVFVKHRITNKSADKGAWRDTYLAIWADVELGGANDDLVGVDSTLSLGFCYNGDNNDETASGTGFGANPPAVGVDFFRGPIVTRNNIKDTLGASAFIRFNNAPGAAPNDPNSAIEVYNFLQGKDAAGQQLPGAPAGSRFMFPGNPETQSGSAFCELPSQIADKRMLIVTGPFDVEYGETQEVVIAWMNARGSSNLNSVTKLKQVDQVAQAAFDANFQLPIFPPVKITATEEDGSVTLSYYDGDKTSPTYTGKTENDTLSLIDRLNNVVIGEPTYFSFQGYNIYQLENATAQGTPETGQRRLIETFDLADGIQNIQDFTDINGNLFFGPVQIGKDKGVQRYIRFGEGSSYKDAFNSGNKLINGRKYYFAVAPYFVNKSFYALSNAGQPIGNSFQEGPRTVIEVTPKAPIGATLGADRGKVIQTDREQALGDDNVLVTIIDSPKLTGGDFKVRLQTDTTWQLINKTINDTISSDAENISGDERYPIVSGAQVKVRRQQSGFRADIQTPPTWEYRRANTSILPTWFQAKTSDSASAAGAGESTFDIDDLNVFGRAGSQPAFNRGIWYPTRTFTSGNPGPSATNIPSDSLKQFKIVFSSTDKQFAYRIIRGATRRVADSSFRTALPPVALRTFAGQLLFSTNYNFDGVYIDTIEVPFRVYDVDAFDGDPTPRQLNAIVVENNDDLYEGGITGTKTNLINFGKIDRKWEPTTAKNGGKEMIYVMESSYNLNIAKYKPVGPSGSAARTNNIIAKPSDFDIYGILWFRKISEAATFVDGDEFIITPNRPLKAGTEYNFSLPKSTVADIDVIRKNNEIDRVSVYPNPYLALNSYEGTREDRFVSFNHLPPTCDIRIFTLNGELVKTIQHRDPTGTNSLDKWDLRNTNSVPVASGMYILYVDAPGIGTKILKLAVIQREERGNSF